MVYFNEDVIAEIEQLKYDPTLKPCFDVLRGCLVWWDERPEKYSGSQYDILIDLWVARYWIYHSDRQEQDWIILTEPIYYKNLWTTVLESGLKWPGFRQERLYLSKEDKEYLESEREAMRRGEF